MTKTLITSATLLFAASISAAPMFDGNQEMEHSALNGVDATMSTAIEPGIGDNFGNLFYFPTSTKAGMGGDPHMGSDDTAGSVLYDVHDIRW